MYVGIVAWFVFCCFACYGDRKHTITNKNFYILFFPILIFIMGLRGISVGVDTKQYFAAYELASSHSIREIINGELNLAMETCYLLFMKVISWGGGSYYVFQFVYAIIYIYGMVYFIKKNTDDPVFATALFLGLDLYLTSFNLQRQMFAVMLLLLAWEKMKKQKWKTTILLVTLAFSIHRTAAVFVLASFLYFIRKNKTLIKLATFAVILLSIHFNKILAWLTVNVPEYRNYYGNHKIIHSAGGVWIIWILIITFSIFSILKKNNKNNSDESLYTDEGIIGIFSLVYVIMNIVGLFFNYAERIGLYFLPFTLLLFLNVTKSIKNVEYQTVFRRSAIIGFLAYFILTSRSSQYDYTLCF